METKALDNISFPTTQSLYRSVWGGGGSILLSKNRSYAEVYNDIDSEITNLFKVVRDQGKHLYERVSLTPFAREEFELAFTKTEEPLERARRTLIRSFMGFGSEGLFFKSTGFRANSSRSGTTPAHDWANYSASLLIIIERLKGVVIENRDAFDCLAAHDSKDTLHYLDPPYVQQTRSRGSYAFEMDNGQHLELIDFVKTLKGKVIISGYENELYDTLDWNIYKKKTHADGAKPRIETLWCNFNAQKNLFS